MEIDSIKEAVLLELSFTYFSLFIFSVNILLMTFN